MFCGFFVCVFGFLVFFDVGWLITYGVVIVLLGVIQFRKKIQQIASHGIGSNLLAEKPAFATDANLGHRQILPEKEIVVSVNESCRYFRCVFHGFLAADSQS